MAAASKGVAAAATAAVAAATAGPGVINRALFSRSVTVLALRVNVQDLHATIKALKGNMYKRRRVKAVVADPADSSKKLLLLDAAFKTVDALPALARAFVAKQQYESCTHSLQLTYDNFSFGEVCSELLPAGQPVSHAFETVGSLAHMNLRFNMLDYKYVIGQALVDKNPTVSTVMNKVGKIDTQFRTFKMELLAGVDNTLVEVHEQKCTFQFDFREVYWNTRLGTEHGRLVSQFTRDDVVCDMMCGVGPFAVPLGRRGVDVYANDLNPESFKYLIHNKAINKIGTSLRCFNMDGRDFVRHLWREDVDDVTRRDNIVAQEQATQARFAAVEHSLTSSSTDRTSRSQKKRLAKKAKAGKAKVNAGNNSSSSSGGGGGAASAAPSKALQHLAEAPNVRKPLPFTQVIMNLPASAVEFLDVFREFPYDAVTTLPTIHCYCFAVGDSAEQVVVQQAEKHLGCRIVDFSVAHVRDVSPDKHMYCLSFKLPDQATMLAGLAGAAGSTSASDGGVGAATSTSTTTGVEAENGTKRQRLS